MTTPLYRPISKNMPGAKAPLASDITQLIDLLNGLLDAGVINLASQISAPSTTGVTVVASTGTTLGVGTYIYKFTYVAGLIQADNTVTVGGETPGSSSLTVTTTSGNQNVTISGLPGVANWPSTAIGIRIYRTAVGGADGTQKLVGVIYTNYARNTSQTSFTDSTSDVSLGTAIPTTNTTGTTLNTGYMSADNTSFKVKDKNALNAFQVWLDGTKKVTTANNTLDDGSGGATFAGLVYTKGLYTNGGSTSEVGTGGAIQILSGYASPLSGRIIFGDGTGWQMRFAKRNGTTTTDLFTLYDSGKLTTPNNTLDDGSGNAAFNSITLGGATGAKIAAGSYTGDGTANRLINVGFTPKYVKVYGTGVHYNGGTGQTMSYETMSTTVGFANGNANNFAFVMQNIGTNFTLATNGFIVNYGNSSSTYGNDGAGTYTYIAIG